MNSQDIVNNRGAWTLKPFTVDQNTQAITGHIVWKHQAFKLHGTQKKASYQVWSTTN